jgi:ABC transport system ATP-binding/permease protein
MSLISLHSISIAFGGPLLLDNVSLDIQKGQRICMLGRNGAGKSTFMKIIAGEIAPDAGEIITEPGVRIAYLPQEVSTDSAGSVFEVVARGAGASGEKLEQLHKLISAHADHALIDELHQYLDHHDGWRVQTAIERILDQTGLDGAANFDALSGGMRRRVFLARALVREPQLLLLDEPTNHLDIESISWLEAFVVSSKITTLFVTHDRRFLKRLATRIIELDRGRIVDWACDYETFLVRKQAVLDAEETEWKRFDKKLAQEEVWIRRGIKARRTRNEGRVRALVKMREERRKRRQRSGTASMVISSATRSGDRVLEAVDVSFSYNDKPLVRGLTTTIIRGDKIGIIGPNGCGKTTLINILLGKIPPQAGTVAFGANISPVYFDQLREGLALDKTVWENVASRGADTVFVNGSPKHVISYLQDFLFTSDRAKCPAKQLSGGERNRLMLARMFTQPANILVFDEPTNDLDTETLELLEEILLDFKGTVLVVSHDREFLNNIVTQTLAFEGDGVVKEYVGGYDDWERQREKPKPVPKDTFFTARKESAGNLPDPGPKKLSFKENRELEMLPGQIEQQERELDALNSQMANSEFYAKPGFVAGARIRAARIGKELDVLYARWQELEQRPR